MVDGVVEDDRPTFAPGPGLRADPQRAMVVRHYQAQVSAADSRDPTRMGLAVCSGNPAGEACGREARIPTQSVCGARAGRQRRIDAAAESDESEDAAASPEPLASYPALERFAAQRQTICPDVSPGAAKI